MPMNSDFVNGQWARIGKRRVPSAVEAVSFSSSSLPQQKQQQQQASMALTADECKEILDSADGDFDSMSSPLFVKCLRKQKNFTSDSLSALDGKLRSEIRSLTV